jgi:chromosome segregation ATPase
METRNDEAAPAEAPAQDDDAPLSADPVTEVRTLRAKNRILRAERTAIAGRKYVLETVVESLRQKLEELARAFATLEGGGDIAEAIRTVGSLVNDAKRIAEDKESLEGELDAERVDRLNERRSREAREFELEERSAGLAAERSVLAERVQTLEQKVTELQQTGSGVEDVKRQLATATAELATAATELERAANDAEARARELGDARTALAAATKERDTLAAEIEEHHASSESVARVKEEHQGELDQLRMDLDHARTERDNLNRTFISAQADHARALEQALEDASKSGDNDRKLREELGATLEAERTRNQKTLEDAAAARRTLETEKAQLAQAAKEADGFKKELADQKPVLDALADKVDELEKELTKLETRLGEYRDRGKVDVKELLVRAALLKRRQEREAQEAAQKPLTRSVKPGQKPATGQAPRPAPAANRPPSATGQVPRASKAPARHGDTDAAG